MTPEEMDIKDRQQRAEQARLLLSDELLQGALQSLEQGYLDTLLECPERDDIGRYRLQVAINTVRTVREHLLAAIGDGKLATESARELKTSRWGF